MSSTYSEKIILKQLRLLSDKWIILSLMNEQNEELAQEMLRRIDKEFERLKQLYQRWNPLYGTEAGT